MKFLNFLAALIISGSSFSQQQVFINEVLANSENIIKPASFDWVELYNPNQSEIRLKGWYLSDEPKNPQKWKFPNIKIKANSFVIIYLSGINFRSKKEVHANFKLSASGEILILSNPKGLIIDCFKSIPCNKGVSYGRTLDGSKQCERFLQPTKQKSNNFSNGIVFSDESGFYNHFLELKLTSKNGDSIRFTEDGSLPNRHSKHYRSKININSRQDEVDVLTPLSKTKVTGSKTKSFKGSVIRAATFKNGTQSSKVYTKTYFTYPSISSKHRGFNVVSLVTDKNNLFQKDTGIYVGDQRIPEANYNNRGINWQRHAHITLFDTSGAIDFAQEVGIRIHGQTTRKYPSKSFRIYANSSRLAPVFQTSVFPKSKSKNFNKLVLKACMGDLQKTVFKDEVTTYICRNLATDMLDYAPCILYINGEYWGIYNLREFLGKNYISNKYKVKKDSVRIIKHGSGLSTMFNGYSQKVDFTDTASYTIITKYLNIESVIDYYSANLFFGNTDYLENNNKLWQIGKSGPWHQFLFDLDFGWMDSKMDNISPLISPSNSPRHPSYATLMFRTLISNPIFKTKFLSRINHLLKHDFSTEKLLQAIALFKNNYKPHVRMHARRWSRPGSVSQWEKKISYLESFAKTRPQYFRKYLLILQ